jgi:hypothetical protein
MIFRFLCGGAIVFLSVFIFKYSVAEEVRDNQPLPSASIVDVLDLTAGEPFIGARTRILKLGWTPVWMHEHDQYDYIGSEKELKSRGYAEVDACSIDAGVLCILYYKKNGQCLRIDTIGERVDHMRVTRWVSECPATPQAGL